MNILLKTGSFAKKIFFFLAGQLILLFLYPVFLLMKIRFIPVNYACIGHLVIELECYVKEGTLRLRPQYKTILLVSRKDVANKHLLNYWKKYVYVMDNPVIFSLLWGSIRRNRLISYNVAKYCHVGAMYGHFAISAYPAIQRQYRGRPAVLTLEDSDRKRGWETLRKLGMPQDSWFVCVHCREMGYSFNRGRGRISIRDVDINNYFLAMQEIVERGGWIIRVGDPTMKVIPKMKNVIDYAHLDIKSDWMDIFLCASCKTFLGSNSGLSSLASVFGVNSAIANIAGPVSAVLPYGTEDIGIPKLIWSKTEKRYLTFKEILSSPIGDFYEDRLFVANNIEPVENSPEDIKELTVEMLDKIEGRLAYSTEDEILQQKFKSLMRPGHYSYGSVSRVGREFLKKYSYLIG